MDDSDSGRGWLAKAAAGVVVIGLLVGAVLFLGESSSPEGAEDKAEQPSAAATPGVSETEIKIGFIINKGGDETFARFYEGAGQEPNFVYGDERRQAQALVDDLNRRGGIADRKIVPIFSASGVFGTDYARICAHLVEDEKVFAAITSETAGLNPELANCFAGRQTPLLTTPLIAGDESFLRDVSPWHRIPLTMADARMWRNLIPDLADRGFFGAGSKVGLMTSNDPRMQRLSEEVVKPELAKIGVPVVDQYKHTVGGLNVLPAVLSFKAKGVTNVLFVPGFELPYLFWRDASFQDYHPHYAVESGSVVEFVRVLLPEIDFTRTIGIGWRPQFDVPDSALPHQALEKRCFKIMRGAGIEVTSRQNPFPATLLCDSMWLFEEAGKKAGRDLTKENWIAGLESLGRREAALTLPLDLSKGDAVTGYRRLAYDKACHCFTYQGDVIPAKD